MARIPYLRWVVWATPALLALLLFPGQAVQASEGAVQEFQAPQFDLNLVRSRSLRWQQPSLFPQREDPPQSEAALAETEHPFLEFTLEESSTAIALFGCDCPAHLNQLRQLRGLPLL
ncbi:MAG: hypothetical protein Q6M04_07710 [Thermostichus sp. BF3_bins_97]